MYRAKQPPFTTDAQVSAMPGTDGGIHVAVTSTILSGPDGCTLGTLAMAYDIKPDAGMTVAGTLNWTAPDTSLWEEELRFSVPSGLTRMAWQRDSFFTDSPAGHVGGPSETGQAGDTLFHAPKRGLHWLTLSDGSGAALAPLSTNMPLLGRADRISAGTTLFAGREVAGLHGLSDSWVEDHASHAVKGSPSPAPSPSGHSMPLA